MKGKSMDTTSHIRILLLEIGIPANLLGFNYIVYAVHLALTNSEYSLRMSKQLYVDVAHHFKTNISAVERCMKHAIVTGMEYGSQELADQIFKNSINPKKGFPTCSQFITSVCLYMARELPDIEQ